MRARTISRKGKNNKIVFFYNKPTFRDKRFFKKKQGDPRKKRVSAS